MGQRLGQAMIIIENPGEEKKVVMCEMERHELDVPLEPGQVPTLIMIQEPNQPIRVHVVPPTPIPPVE